MRWTFWRGEARADEAGDEAGSYADRLTQLLLEQAQGTTRAEPRATAAAVTAATLWARCLTAATVEPAGGRGAAALTPAVRYDIGYALVQGGEYVAALDVDLQAGGLRLIRAASVDVLGTSPNPADWRYRLELPAPSGPSVRVLPAAAVFHVRINAAAASPWRGRSPLQAARLSARTLAEVEAALGDEAAGPRGHLLPVPADGIGSKTDALRADIRKLRGRTAVVETAMTGWGDGQNRAPQRDLQPNRLGANPPPALVQSRDDAHRDVLAACGIPPAMTGQSDGTALREGLRQLLHVTIRPVADLIVAEAVDKLEAPATMNFERLHAADVQGRARAYKSLRDAGMEPAAAAAATGLPGA